MLKNNKNASQGTALTRLTDLALGVIIPVHGHIGLNGVISDYVPPRFMGEFSIPTSHHASNEYTVVNRCFGHPKVLKASGLGLYSWRGCATPKPAPLCARSRCRVVDGLCLW